jgi:hypothetical protein
MMRKEKERREASDGLIGEEVEEVPYQLLEYDF